MFVVHFGLPPDHSHFLASLTLFFFFFFGTKFLTGFKPVYHRKNNSSDSFLLVWSWDLLAITAGEQLHRHTQLHPRCPSTKLKASASFATAWASVIWGPCSAGQRISLPSRPSQQDWTLTTAQAQWKQGQSYHTDNQVVALGQLDTSCEASNLSWVLSLHRGPSSSNSILTRNQCSPTLLGASKAETVPHVCSALELQDVKVAQWSGKGKSRTQSGEMSKDYSATTERRKGNKAQRKADPNSETAANHERCWTVPNRSNFAPNSPWGRGPLDKPQLRNSALCNKIRQGL